MLVIIVKNLKQCKSIQINQDILSYYQKYSATLYGSRFATIDELRIMTKNELYNRESINQ